jgi:hypothetical protein
VKASWSLLLTAKTRYELTTGSSEPAPCTVDAVCLAELAGACAA